ncbi:M20 family peptidase [Microbacterium mitrae]
MTSLEPLALTPYGESMPDLSNIEVRPGAAERLSRMIQLPTVSAELDARGLSDFDAFIELIAELYPLVTATLDHEKLHDLGHLYRWRGTTPSDAPVVLMAHYDVVPVDESDAWTYPPFSGTIADGNVYGRGALDDKGPLLVILEAVENLLAAGFTPARDVYLSFGGNEESFGSAAVAIAAELQRRKIVPWLVIDEGGAVVIDPLPMVRGQAAMIGVGEKGLMTVRLVARGDGGHASFPPPLTAVGRVSRAVDRLTPSTFPARAPRAVSRMLSTFANRVSGPAAFGLKALAALPPVTAMLFAKLGGEPAAMVRTTVAPTMLAGGTADNVLPSQASATVNLRIALGETVPSTLKRLRKRINDPQISIEVVASSDPSPESSADNEQFAAIAAALAASHPDAIAVPYVVFAATDSRHFHTFSPATYRFAPLLMSTAQRAAIHGVDEWVALSELERGEKFHRALLTALTSSR